MLMFPLHRDSRWVPVVVLPQWELFREWWHDEASITVHPCQLDHTAALALLKVYRVSSFSLSLCNTAKNCSSVAMSTTEALNQIYFKMPINSFIEEY